MAIFGAGCFWGVQEAFSKLPGVVLTEVGYMGGNDKDYPNPTYEEVCSDKTGHVEVVRVVYDSDKINYKSLLDFFWKIHDPTQVNGQGNDIGSQYRSLIFYFDESQRRKVISSLHKEQKNYGEMIMTDILDGNEFTFHRAEAYHQNYFQHRKRGFLKT